MAETNTDLNTLRFEAYRRFAASKGLLSLLPYPAESPIAIDLLDTEDGIPDEFAASLYGRIEDGRHGIVRIVYSEGYDELLGQRIGLGARRQLMTPAGIAVEATLKATITQYGEFAYFRPEEVDLGTGFGCPNTDQYHYSPLRYGRLTVAGTELFDYRDTVQQALGLPQET